MNRLFHRSFTLQAPGKGIEREKVIAALERGGFAESKHGRTWESPAEHLFLDAKVVEEEARVKRIVLSLPRGAIHDLEALKKRAADLAGSLDCSAIDDDTGASIPVRTRTSIGLELFDQEKWEEAIAVFKEAIELDDTSLQAWHALAACYERLDRWAESVPPFRKAVELGGGGESWSGLGRALADLGEYDESLDVLQKAVEKWPESARLLTDLASTISDQKRFAESLAVLERARTADPSYALAYTNSAYCLNMMGKHDDAYVMAEKAMQLDPDDAFMVYNLACTCCQMKNADRALELLERAIRMDAEFKEKAPLEPELSWLHEDERFKRLCR